MKFRFYIHKYNTLLRLKENFMCQNMTFLNNIVSGFKLFPFSNTVSQCGIQMSDAYSNSRDDNSKNFAQNSAVTLKVLLTYG